VPVVETLLVLSSSDSLPESLYPFPEGRPGTMSNKWKGTKPVLHEFALSLFLSDSDARLPYVPPYTRFFPSNPIACPCTRLASPLREDEAAFLRAATSCPLLPIPPHPVLNPVIRNLPYPVHVQHTKILSPVFGNFNNTPHSFPFDFLGLANISHCGHDVLSRPCLPHLSPPSTVNP